MNELTGLSIAVAFYGGCKKNVLIEPKKVTEEGFHRELLKLRQGYSDMFYSR
jgi:hypothetical protein